MADFGVRITLSTSSDLPNYTAGIWTNGVAKLSSGEDVGSGWTTGALLSCSPLGERADLAGGGNYVETSEASIVIESTHWPAFQAAGASIYGALVEVGTLSGPTLTVLWSGVVADADWSGPALSLSVESITSRRHREIPRLSVTSDDLDGLTVDPAGTPIPIIYGGVERMAPIRLQSTRSLAGMILRSSANEIEYQTTGIYPTGTNTVSVVSIVAARNVVVGSKSFEGTWYEALLAGATVYMDVIAGTGSGQRRQILSTGTTYEDGVNPKTFAARCSVTVDLAAPLDRTSVIQLDVVENLVDLAIADEATVSRVYTDTGRTEFEIPFTATTAQGFVSVDASGEFWDGEKMTSAVTVRGAETWGVPELVDGASLTGRTIKSPGTVDPPGRVAAYDAYCRTKITYNQIPKDAIDSNAACKVCLSFDLSDLPINSPTFAEVGFSVSAYVTDFYGARHDIHREPQDAQFIFDGPTRNAFGGFNSTDGSPGNYSLGKIALPLPIPLSEVASIVTAIVPIYNQFQSSDSFNAIVTAGSNVIQAQDTVPGGFVVGQWIRQRYSANLDFGMPVSNSTNYSIYKADAWRQILFITGNLLTVSDCEDWDVGAAIEFLRVADSAMFDVVEREAAISFEFGEVSTDAQFLADATGRRYSDAIWPTLSGVEDPDGNTVASGETINMARSAALDIMYRDLELGAGEVDQSAFLALRQAAITWILPSKQNSRDAFAQMAREFGWVLAHDHQGRETASSLFSRVGSTEFDLEITNGEIISGSIEGLQATSLEDITTLPQVFGLWTQADGARLSYGVKDLSINPLALTSVNYKDYVFGFSEFDDNVIEFYSYFYSGKSISGSENSGSIEINMHSGHSSAEMMRKRFAWISRRKPILSMLVTEDHAALLSHVGQRVKVTHRRYAPSGLYGVLAAKFWNPEQGNISLTVMIDPPSVGGGETEGGWGFNWGNDWGVTV